MENSIKTVTIDMYAGLQLAPRLDNRPGPQDRYYLGKDHAWCILTATNLRLKSRSLWHQCQLSSNSQISKSGQESTTHSTNLVPVPVQVVPVSLSLFHSSDGACPGRTSPIPPVRCRESPVCLEHSNHHCCTPSRPPLLPGRTPVSTTAASHQLENVASTNADLLCQC